MGRPPVRLSSAPATRVARSGRRARRGPVLLRASPLRRRLFRLYDALLARFGPQSWWPARSAFEVVVGAILTQSTAWTNVERAIVALRRAGALRATALARLPSRRPPGPPPAPAGAAPPPPPAGPAASPSRRFAPSSSPSRASAPRRPTRSSSTR